MIVPPNPPPPSESSNSSREVIPVDTPPPSTVFKKKPILPPLYPVFRLGENPAGSAAATLDYGPINAYLSQNCSARTKKLTPTEKVITNSYDIYGKICAAIAALSVLGVIATDKKK